MSGKSIDFIEKKRNSCLDDPAFEAWLSQTRSRCIPREDLEYLRYSYMPNTYWRCSCGCVYFFIAPSGLVCSECGTEAKGF